MNKKLTLATALASCVGASDLSDYVQQHAFASGRPENVAPYVAYVISMPAPAGYASAQFQYSAHDTPTKSYFALTLVAPNQTLTVIMDEGADERPDSAYAAQGDVRINIRLDDRVRQLYANTIKAVRAQMARARQGKK